MLRRWNSSFTRSDVSAILQYWHLTLSRSEQSIPRPTSLSPHPGIEAMRRLTQWQNSIASPTQPSPFPETNPHSLPHSLTRLCCTAFLNMNTSAQSTFVRILATELGPDREATKQATQEYLQLLNQPCKDESYAVRIQRAELALQNCLTPLYRRLLHEMFMLQNGHVVVFRLRERLLELLKTAHQETRADGAALRAMNAHLRELLRTWFNSASLQLKCITRESACLETLSFLMEREAVHPTKDWSQFLNRFGATRLCFGLVHATRPLYPVAFVMVALMDHMPTAIQPILSNSLPDQSNQTLNHAVFYAISSTEKALSGIDLGHELLSRVIPYCRQHWPQLQVLVTLSPIPGFGHWLRERINEEDPMMASLQSFKSVLMSRTSPSKEMLQLLQSLLLPLCLNYLIKERRRGSLLDPVAHFHLRNGAQLRRVLWQADVSDRGWWQSYGCMVNYLYEWEYLEERHENYVLHGKVHVHPDIQI